MKYRRIFKHTLFFSLLLCLSNFLFVSNFSFMGIQSDSVSELIRNEFISSILLQLAYILMYYIFISAIYASLLFQCSFIQNYKKIYLVLFFLHFTLFHSQIILTPAFFDEASKRYFVLRFYMEFLTDNFSPYFFIFCFTFIVLLIILFSSRTKQLICCFILSATFLSKSDLSFGGNPQTGKTNVLILSADSFRKKDASSFHIFKQLESYGKVFNHEKMFTAIPRTFPSWASILTGKYPQNHYIFNMFPNKRQQAMETSRTLAEILNNMNYKTTVISDFAGDIFSRGQFKFKHIKTPYFNIETMIKQGLLESQVNLFPYLFNSIARLIFPEIEGIAKLPNAKRLRDETIQELKKEKEKAFFITTFFSDAHFPYATSYPYYRVNDQYTGTFKYLKNQLLTKETTSENDQKHIRKLFLAAERSIKDRLDEVLSYLIETKLIENTLILFFSDHGENLFDYENIIGHGEHLYDQTTLNIPFYLFVQSKISVKGDFRKKIASTVDIMPTILHLLNIEPEKNIDGSSLFIDSNNTVFSETGLWFTNANGDFYQNERILYPNIVELLEIEWENDAQASLRTDYLPITEKAKHRILINDSIVFMYLPTDSAVKWKIYHNGNWKDQMIPENLKKIFFNHYSNRFTMEDAYLYLNAMSW